MIAAAAELQTRSDDARAPVVLLADSHALTEGHDQSVVERRAAIRRVEIECISIALGIELQVIESSQLDRFARFQQALREIESGRAGIQNGQGESVSRYTARGVADVLYFAGLGMTKVGWSKRADLTSGRHNEPETDRFASKINPAVSAAYVRHGVSLDPLRRVAVPYSELKNTAERLMLTGTDRGRFREKITAILAGSASARRQCETVCAHLEVCINSLQGLVGRLEGTDVIEQAEAIVHRVNAQLSRVDAGVVKRGGL